MTKNKKLHTAVLVFGALLGAWGSSAVQAGRLGERAVCTVYPGQAWLGEQKIKEIFHASEYLEVELKVSASNCYEFHAIKKNGDVVEAYYHPVTGAIVEHEVLTRKGGQIIEDVKPEAASPANAANAANAASAAHHPHHAGKTPAPATGLVVY